jgi:glycosyltransferase involved in cell wall biosynthesis
MTTRVLLDITRLLKNAARPTPTGILRVELAYAEHWLATRPDHIAFAAGTAFRRIGLVERERAAAFIAEISRLWRDGEASWRTLWRLRLRAALIFATLFCRGEAPLHRRLRRGRGRAVYIIVSHAHLDAPAKVARLKERTGVRLAYFVHDLIPWQYPELDTPGWEARVARRAAAAVRLADAIIVNSEDTRATFRRMLPHPESHPPVVVAPLGVSCRVTDDAAAKPAGGPPYFVILGTIEPKKNHFFLLSLWRQLREQVGDAAPRLIVVGRRGWENENVVDMLERSRILRGFVEERGRLSDSAAAALLAGARALLVASVAEGYGLPLAEALSLGVPAICSNLPSLREVGASVPEYIDPLDGPSWRRAILDYAAPESPRRAAQLERLRAWRAPRWESHFERIDALVTALGAAQAEAVAPPFASPGMVVDATAAD